MQNFNQLFPQSNSSAAPKLIKLLGGSVTVFRRANSSNWQCRFKLANGAWHTASTGTEDPDQAEIQAVAIYETVKVRVGNGLAVVTKTFKQIALDETANMMQAILDSRIQAWR